MFASVGTFEIPNLGHCKQIPGLAKGQLLDYNNWTNVESHLCQTCLHIIQVLNHEVYYGVYESHLWLSLDLLQLIFLLIV